MEGLINGAIGLKANEEKTKGSLEGGGRKKSAAQGVEATKKGITAKEKNRWQDGIVNENQKRLQEAGRVQANGKKKIKGL